MARRQLVERAVLFAVLALIVVVPVVLLSVAMSWPAEANDPARARVDEFHAEYQSGDFDAIYAAAHPKLQQDVTAADAARKLGDVRARLGEVVDMSFGCATRVGGKGQPETVRIEYRVMFTNGEAWETYDWRTEADKLRLLAYAVETGFEDGSPDWEVALAPSGVRPNATTCAAEEEQLHWWERQNI